MKNIGMIGLGTMGAGMAANLQAKGFALSVYARHAARVQAAVDRGARRVDSPAALAAGCEAVVLCVSDTAAVEQLLFGADGLATGAPGALRYVIDTSTIAADACRTFAERLAAQGIAFLDAPVSGGPRGAADGTLTCMVGGTQEAFDACLPVMQTFARTVTRIGGPGAGQVCKACNQIGVIANLLGVAEMVALCAGHGVDPMVVRSVLLTGSSRSAVLENHALRLIERNFAPTFRADLMAKDLRLVQALEEACGLEGTVAAAAAPLFAQLLAQGGGAQDWSAVGELAARKR